MIDWDGYNFLSIFNKATIERLSVSVAQFIFTITSGKLDAMGIHENFSKNLFSAHFLCVILQLRNDEEKILDGIESIQRYSDIFLIPAEFYWAILEE